MKAILIRWLGWARDPALAHRVAILSETPMFAGLSTRALRRLAAMLFEKAYAPGDVVFFTGDPAQALFVVLDGSVEILIPVPGGEDRVASCGPGTVFGELALINDLPRSATARATAPTQLLILYHADFEELLKRHRRVAVVVMQNLLVTLARYVQVARVSAAAHVPVREDAPPSAIPRSRKARALPAVV